jgi:NlpC/P60 family putative phage cell wall peptidase
MATAAAFVAAARACLGTPFHHQGRQVGGGLDCIGLVVVALRAVGISVNDRTDYGPRPDGVSLITALETHGASRVDTITAGDVLLFRFDGQPQHVAVATGADSMVHSYAPVARVVETNISAPWRRRLVAIFRFSFEAE